MTNQLQIRNSTADFLIFTRQNGEDGIAVRVEDENVWLQSEAMAMLFQKDRRTVQEHLKNIFADNELDENTVGRNFRHTAADGKNYNVKFYSLEAIIAVGYRTDSERAIQFRQWATGVLSQFAIHRHTAAELIMKRSDAKEKNMGLTSWKNAPHGKIIKTDVSVAKNYLSQLELSELNEIVTMYLDYANRQARRFIPMTMDDWKNKLDAFLNFNDAELSDGIGRVTHEIAKTFAESEFEKYRVIQDKTYQSDFDRLVYQSQNLLSNE
jgi:hypothetical protein